MIFAGRPNFESYVQGCYSYFDAGWGSLEILVGGVGNEMSILP